MDFGRNDFIFVGFNIRGKLVSVINLSNCFLRWFLVVSLIF